MEMDTTEGEISWNAVRELDQRLRPENLKGTSSEQTKALRKKLQATCVSLILEQHEVATAHDVHLIMWNRCFHQVRGILRANIARLKDPKLAKEAADEFQSFLSSSIRFYRKLFRDLQLQGSLDLRGLVEDSLIHHDWKPQLPGAGAADQDYCLRACTRCLIALGDLTRYAQELRGAARYYDEALNLSPEQGNAHNQLAVISMYLDQTFSAVYHYMRSLAVRVPFVTAKENLLSVFERNRRALQPFMHYIDGGTRNKRRGGGAKKTKLPSVEKGSEEKVFWLALIRLQDMLISPSGGELLSSVKTFVLRMFTLLVNHHTFKEADLNRIVVSMIFAVHGMEWTKAHTKEMREEEHVHHFQSLQMSSKPQQCMVSFVIELSMPIIARATSVLKEQSEGGSRECRHLASINILLRWMCLYPEVLSATGSPRSVQEKRRSFWLSVSQLANLCLRSQYTPEALAEIRSNRHKLPLLDEEVELRGFLCLEPALADLPCLQEHMRSRDSPDHAAFLSQLGVAHTFSVSQVLRMSLLLDIVHKIAASKTLNALYYSEGKNRFGAKSISSESRTSSKKREQPAAQNGNGHASSQPMKIATRRQRGPPGQTKQNGVPVNGSGRMHVGAMPHVPSGSPSRSSYSADPLASAALASCMKEKEMEAANAHFGNGSTSPIASPLHASPLQLPQADGGVFDSDLFKPGEGARVDSYERRDHLCPAIGSGRDLQFPNAHMYADANGWGLGVFDDLEGEEHPLDTDAVEMELEVAAIISDHGHCDQERDHEREEEEERGHSAHTTPSRFSEGHRSPALGPTLDAFSPVMSAYGGGGHADAHGGGGGGFGSSLFSYTSEPNAVNAMGPARFSFMGPEDGAGDSFDNRGDSFDNRGDSFEGEEGRSLFMFSGGGRSAFFAALSGDVADDGGAARGADPGRGEHDDAQAHLHQWEGMHTPHHVLSGGKAAQWELNMASSDGMGSRVIT